MTQELSEENLYEAIVDFTGNNDLLLENSVLDAYIRVKTNNNSKNSE